MRATTAAFLFLVVIPSAARCAEHANAYRRLQADVRAGRPLVVHVVVALADNESQGIVKVKPELGNGADPKNNLYWGAMFGVRSFMTQRAGWKVVPERPEPPRRRAILDRLVMHLSLLSAGRAIEVYVVAEAWGGSEIRGATMRFLRLAAGHSSETVTVETPRGPKEIRAGGASHLVVYVGHNGLMDFKVRRVPGPSREAEPRSAVVLACKSRDYYSGSLRKAGAEVLLVTTGLMAPEAYVLDAAIRSWAVGDAAQLVAAKAAVAYNTYQKCGLAAAKRLFATGTRK